MKGTALPYWLAFAMLVALLYGGYKMYQVGEWQDHGTSSTVAEKLPPLEDFELTERSGKPFRSADMKGKVWVATFFFSTCQGSCSRLNSQIQHLTTLDEIRDATWVSISVDPVNDTLPVLRDYADRHNADPQRWLFCRGELGYIKRLADDYLKVGGVIYQSHKDYAVVVDKEGKVAGMFNATSTIDAEKGVELIKQCLAAKAPSDAEREKQKTAKAKPHGAEAA